MEGQNTTYRRVSETLEWLAAHRERQPALSDIAEAVGMSPWHLQRTFQRWAGISPKKFLQAMIHSGHHVGQCITGRNQASIRVELQDQAGAAGQRL